MRVHPKRQGASAAPNREAVLVVAAVAVLAATSCGRESCDGSSMVAATYEEQGTGGDSALLAGGLEKAGRCLVIRDEVGEEWVVYVPTGDFVATGDEDFRLFGRAFRLGDKVTLGGGYYEPPGATVPDACEVAVSDLPAFTAYQGSP
ncbi:MAG: hypothetical protein LBK95_00385 [Bifidobacteriaceae bacterium]|jgi:hypothetical protein|nr:hypothetical protein [Bifidobacteriaceae bacterium]